MIWFWLSFGFFLLNILIIDGHMTFLDYTVLYPDYLAYSILKVETSLFFILSALSFMKNKNIVVKTFSIFLGLYYLVALLLAFSPD